MCQVFRTNCRFTSNVAYGFVLAWKVCHVWWLWRNTQSLVLFPKWWHILQRGFLQVNMHTYWNDLIFHNFEIILIKSSSKSPQFEILEIQAFYCNIFSLVVMCTLSCCSSRNSVFQKFTGYLRKSYFQTLCSKMQWLFWKFLSKWHGTASRASQSALFSCPMFFMRNLQSWVRNWGRIFHSQWSYVAMQRWLPWTPSILSRWDYMFI